MSSGRAKRRGWWRARSWHRWLGGILAIPLLWLTVSGLLLNHAEGLGMNRKVVRSSWLLDRYGMRPEGDAYGARVGTRRVTEWGGLLFLDDVLLEEEGTLVGAVAVGADLVVGTSEVLYVYGAQGGLVDVMDEASLPALPLGRIGKSDEGVLAVQGGGKTWVVKAGSLDFEESDGEGFTWSEVTGVEKAGLEEALGEGAGIPWSRVVLDLHSGNLFGGPGRFLVDLTGIGVVLMTLFGIKLLFKRMK